DAFDPFLFYCAQGLDIGEVRNTARGDDRDPDVLGQTHRRVDIDASEHAVAADIGVDNRFDTVVFKLATKIEHIMLGQFTPPIGRHFASLGIEADNDIAWKSAAGILQKARILHRRRTDNDVLDAEIQVPFNGVQIAHAAADLHRDVVSASPHDGL